MLLLQQINATKNPTANRRELKIDAPGWQTIVNGNDERELLTMLLMKMNNGQVEDTQLSYFRIINNNKVLTF